MQSNDTLRSIVERIEIEPSLAEALLELELSDDDMDRVHALLSQEDAFPGAEREELVVYLLLDEFLRLLQAKASEEV